MIITNSSHLHETETGRTRVRYNMATGFSIATLDVKSQALSDLPIDPAAIDALVEQWPAFKAMCLSTAPAQNVVPVTLSRGVFKDGPDASSSRSSPTPLDTTAFGTGALPSASEKAKDAASSPSEPRTQLL